MIRLLKRAEPYLMITPALILLLLFLTYPVIEGFSLAFKHYILYEPNNIHFNGFENFKEIFAREEFWLVIRNSFVWVFLSVLLQFVFGLAMAVTLNKKFFGRGILQGIFFVPWAFAGFLVAVIFRWMMNGEYGVINDVLLRIGIISEPIGFLSNPDTSLFSVIIASVWYGVPFFAMMLLAAMQGVSREIYEAAEIDGASLPRQFIFITLPFIMPTILATLLLRSLWLFNAADLIFIMTNGGPAYSSEILATFIFKNAYSGLNFGEAAATGIVMIIILVIFSLVFIKLTNFNKRGDF